MSSPELRVLLNELQIGGVNLELAGNKLRCVAPKGFIFPEFNKFLADNKPAIIHILQGKALINRAIDEIINLWDQVEESGASIAWEWIMRSSPYGRKIKAAENEVDRIGSTGDLTALDYACKAWVSSWREGIEGWKKQQLFVGGCNPDSFR